MVSEKKRQIKPLVHVFNVKNQIIMLVAKCQTVSSVEYHRLVFSKKKLCFNCTGSKHRASEYPSNQNVQFKIPYFNFYTSIWDKNKNVVLAANDNTFSYPVVILIIEKITCRASIDTRARASYVSTTVINRINKEAIRAEPKRIETRVFSPCI